MITGTHLAVVPAMMVPAYSAAKAAARAFFDCLRAQNEGSNVRFVDIGTPMVQSKSLRVHNQYFDQILIFLAELHDYMGEERGRAMGMPVDAFVNQVFQQLDQGVEDVVVGTVGLSNADDLKTLLECRGRLLGELNTLMRQSW